MVFALYVPMAGATAVLTLDDGIALDKVTVSDTDGDGIVTYFGSVGSQWIVNLTAGLTKPTLGTATAPHMDLSSQNTSNSRQSANLTITFTDDGFNYSGPLKMLVGGTTNGTVSFETQVNGSSIGILGPFSTGAFSGSTGGSASSADTLAMIATINHPGGSSAKVTSFDYEITVPEPGMLLLFGSGLVGLGLFRRRNA